jgi:TRAP-type transport system periplasmic protein
MRQATIGLLFLVALGLPAGAAAGDKVTLKLGTLAPDGSSWHQLLKEMAAEWSQASGGTVVVKIYAGGVAGNEGDMARKLRIGQLQAAAISAVGLADIYTGPEAISCPGLIADDEEWKYVFPRATPAWERVMEEKGYVVLMWGDTGWVHMFLKDPVKSPAELAGLKVFAWAGDPSSTAAFQLAGFEPVVLSATDMLPSLSTGMIVGFSATPAMALGARWYESAPHMTSTAWGHLPGATIVSRAAWEKIPEPTRARLLEIARVYSVRVNDEVTRMQTDAIAAMKKNGLKVLEFDAAGRAQWQAICERTWPAVRGGVVTPEDFDAVKRIRDEYRAQKSKQP